MSKSTELTTEQVLAFMAANPNALRLASAQSAAELLNGEAVQAVVDQLTAAVAASHDSVPALPGQPRTLGQEGVSQSLTRIPGAITLGRGAVAARVAALTPVPAEVAASPET